MLIPPLGATTTFSGPLALSSWISAALAYVCIIALFYCSILLGVRLWIFISIGYICLSHDFPGVALVLPLCILTDVLNSPIDLFVVICWTLIKLSYIIL
jgi:hypothetical protein